MLGRLFHAANGPISANCNEAIVPQKRKLDLEQELKLGIEYIFQLNEKLSNLSWEARNIIEAWLQNGKSF